MAQRQKIVPLATGVVLEIGIGTGLNLPFYDPGRVEKVVGLDPSENSWKLASRRIASAKVEVEFVGLPGEEIPLDEASVDTVLITYTLCTIPNPLIALRSIKRVMKPEAKLVFCEHGIAPDQTVVKWQNRLNPIWNRLAGGCDLNLNIPELIDSGGFEIQTLETGYLQGIPKFANFNFWGTACLA